MLDIGWTELFVVGIVALIVIGPKDLPGALHTFGKYVGQLRRMVRQFQDGIDDIARQEELRELQKTVSDVANPRRLERYLDSDIDDTAKAAKPTAGDAAGTHGDGHSIAQAEPHAASEPQGEATPEPKPNTTTSS